MSSAAANASMPTRVGERAGVERAQVGDAVDQVEHDAAGRVVVAGDEHVARRASCVEVAERGRRDEVEARRRPRRRAPRPAPRRDRALGGTTRAELAARASRGRSPSRSRSCPSSWSAWAAAVATAASHTVASTTTLGVRGVVVRARLEAVDPVAPAVPQLGDHARRPVARPATRPRRRGPRSPAGPRRPAPPAPSPPTLRSACRELRTRPLPTPADIRARRAFACRPSEHSTAWLDGADECHTSLRRRRHVGHARCPHRAHAARSRHHAPGTARADRRAARRPVRPGDSSRFATACTASAGAPRDLAPAILHGGVPRRRADVSVSFRAAAALWRARGVLAATGSRSRCRARTAARTRRRRSSTRAPWSTARRIVAVVEHDPGSLRSHARSCDLTAVVRPWMVERAVDEALRREARDAAVTRTVVAESLDGPRPASRAP